MEFHAGVDQSRWVIKLGGSLLSSPDWPERFRKWQKQVGVSTADVIVGGGPRVDALRRQAAAEQWDDSRSHWQAIAAMDANAQNVAQLTGLPLFAPSGEQNASFSSVSALPSISTWRILQLGPLLRQVDPLPHSWEITSDSISAWWAQRIGASGVFLLKSRAARPGWDPRQDDDQGLVDPCFRQVLAPGIQVRVVSQWDSAEVANLRAPMPRV